MDNRSPFPATAEVDKESPEGYNEKVNEKEQER